MGFSPIVSQHNRTAFKERQVRVVKVAKGRDHADLQRITTALGLPPLEEKAEGPAGRWDFLPFVGLFVLFLL